VTDRSEREKREREEGEGEGEGDEAIDRDYLSLI
jgi:hypothetical protein